VKGRKPDPGAARRGTARHRKSTDIVPVELSGAIAGEQTALIRPPRTVPQTKAVKELWQVLLGEVARHELRAGDLPLLEAMFVAKVRHAQAGAYVRKHGPIIHIEEPPEYDETGQLVRPAVTIGPMKNPMLKEERDQAALYDRIAQRFGLSPEARIRLDLMQIAGASLLGSLRKSLDEVARTGTAAPGDEVIDAEIVEG
jgi:P27 family predicted phage terminase small subunit